MTDGVDWATCRIKKIFILTFGVILSVAFMVDTGFTVENGKSLSSKFDWDACYKSSDWQKIEKDWWKQYHSLWDSWDGDCQKSFVKSLHDNSYKMPAAIDHKCTQLFGALINHANNVPCQKNPLTEDEYRRYFIVRESRADAKYRNRDWVRGHGRPPEMDQLPPPVRDTLDAAIALQRRASVDPDNTELKKLADEAWVSASKNEYFAQILKECGSDCIQASGWKD